MSEVRSRPVEEGLFTWPDVEPQLIGCRCTQCGTIGFPTLPFCPSCSDPAMEPHPLGRFGTVWTWTSQEFPPKGPPFLGDDDPERYEPFVVAYVELPGELRVEARLTDVDRSEVHIGMEVETTVVPFAIDDDGVEILTFAFRPTDSPAASQAEGRERTPS